MAVALLRTISDIIGWVYFLAWSWSFYPQNVLNWQRKSVVGLHFDFLAYNLTGHTVYLFFNAALFWNKTIQHQYYQRHPGSPVPVHANDVFFSFHAVALTLLTALQCVVYERGGQTVSKACRGTLLVCYACILQFAAVAWLGGVDWLSFFNFLGDIKLLMSLLKYIPQAWFNYTRKSTDGWSIGAILLDMTGGVLSLLQMALDSVIDDDWTNFTGNIAKLGLGGLTIVFDTIFCVQEYCLYAKPSKERQTGLRLLDDATDTSLAADAEEEDDDDEAHGVIADVEGWPSSGRSHPASGNTGDRHPGDRDDAATHLEQLEEMLMMSQISEDDADLATAAAAAAATTSPGAAVRRGGGEDVTKRLLS